MAAAAVFDSSGGDCYIQKNIAVSGGAATAQFIAEFLLSTACLSACQTAGGYTANFCSMENFNELGGVYGPPWGYITRYALNGSPPTLTADAFVTIQCDIDLGTSFSTWTIDGGSPVGPDYGFSAGDTPQFKLGGFGANHVANEVYKLRSFLFKVDGSTVFSDDFSSLDFATGGWTLVGSPTIDPTGGDVGGGGGGTGAQPEGVAIAFNDATLEPAPTWTRIDA